MGGGLVDGERPAMTGTKKAQLLLAAALLALIAQPARPGCLRYEPAEVELVGVMTRETFPGRPNYESVEAGDEPETHWILALEKPVCVDGTKGDDTDVSERGVQRLQLVLSQDQYAACGFLLGRKVRVSGTLFHAITGHHHTSVLMTVGRIEPAA